MHPLLSLLHPLPSPLKFTPPWPTHLHTPLASCSFGERHAQPPSYCSPVYSEEGAPEAGADPQPITLTGVSAASA
jgi:hypothetical protein